MAVQAQHFSSSNLIFLNNNNNNNNRNGKEQEQDFSLQSQAGEFLHQTNIGSNQRKKGRESNNHELPKQSQFPQVIDLSLLHNHNHPPSNMVYTGLRLFSGEDPTRKISDVVAANIHKQSEELDEFLRAQAEELRRTLAEKRKIHYKALVSAVEEPLVRKLKEKEAEIERATRRYNELAARDAQLRAESQVWQERARWHEAAAASLQAQLCNVKAAQDSRAAEEGILCAAGNSGLDDAESVYVDPERTRRPRCKSCRKREATVVLLPCRHLSLCPECDRTALACPVCLTLRNSSVDVIIC